MIFLRADEHISASIDDVYGGVHEQRGTALLAPETSLPCSNFSCAHAHSAVLHVAMLQLLPELYCALFPRPQRT